MNFDVDEQTIYLVNHGSHAYGLATATSDRDIKGVCIEPIEYYFGFLHHFEQLERLAAKGNPADLVVYSLRKFAKLATDCNPNIIEVLWVDDADVLKINTYGEELRSMRQMFLSKKAKHTFSGYAHAQLKRIKSHRSWLLNPPKDRPGRKDFGLSEERKVSKSDIGAYDALVRDGGQPELSENMLTLYARERAYLSALNMWKQYCNWKETRNPTRAALEAKHNFDTKHASHLIRLMRMCKEILTEHAVHVMRHDREEILAVKTGERTYDSVLEEAERLEAECDELYKTSTLPHEPDRVTIDKTIVDMIDRYTRRK